VSVAAVTPDVREPPDAADPDPVTPSDAQARDRARFGVLLSTALESDTLLFQAFVALEKLAAVHGKRIDPHATLAKYLWTGRPAVGTARAEVSGRPGTADAYWQWADDPAGAVEVLTLPIVEVIAPSVSPRPPRCLELLAIDAVDPRRWWRATGALWCLGEKAIEDARDSGAPMRLVRTPLDWARAGGAQSGAACVLDWHDPAAERLLLDRTVPALVADDAAHAKALRQRQRQIAPGIPKIEAA